MTARVKSRAMLSITYVSSATDELGVPQLVEMLVAIRTRNEQLEMHRSGVQECSFAGWAMGFNDVGDVDTDSLEGFTAFLAEADEDSAYPAERTWRMLRAFRRRLG